MTQENTQKLAKHIMRLLKVRSVSFPVAITDKGPLSIKYYEQGDYEMVLDAVPLTTADMLTDENNIELKAVLEKYHFELPRIGIATYSITANAAVAIPAKKKGRPVGSKNGKRTHQTGK